MPKARITGAAPAPAQAQATPEPQEWQVYLRHEPMEKGQAERLMPLLEELMAEAGLAWSDLTAIVVGIGPGNFTGVRIAVACARGLALALKIPCVGVTRLEALAYAMPRPLRVIEDARRGMVYQQDFSADGSTGPAELLALEPELAGAQPLPQGQIVTGSAAGAAAAPPAMALVEAVARIGVLRARSPGPRPAPFYLRPADAAPPSDPPPRILDAKPDLSADGRTDG